MNVTEMLRRLRVSLNDSIEPYSISTDQLYLLLQNSYMSIQRRSTQWSFLHKRGKLLTSVVGKEDYITGSVEHINPQSVYAIEDGTTQRIPLCVKHYRDWVSEESSGVTNTGTPLWLIHTPSFSWKLNPVPTSVWVVYADYWVTPSEFTSQGDEPIWDEEFHEIVLMEAMEMASMLKPDSKESVLMNAQVANLLPALTANFASRYLPTTRGAGPLL